MNPDWSYRPRPFPGGRACKRCGRFAHSDYCDDCHAKLFRPEDAPKPEPLTPEPPVAKYELRPCLFCQALTEREACSRCRALKLAVPFGHLREKVQSGQITDWPDEQWTHSELQTNWQCAAPKAAWRIFKDIIDEAKDRGFNTLRHMSRQWFFHPEYFGEDEKAA